MSVMIWSVMLVGHKTVAYAEMGLGLKPPISHSINFWDPEGGSQNATLVVVVVVVGISSLKISKAFLIHSGAQRNFAYTFICSLFG